MHPATKRWLKRIGIAVAVLLVLLTVGLWWLLGTSSGMQFALARVTAASNGDLSIQSSRGDLAGPLQLSGVDYRDRETGTHAHIKHLSVDLAVWSLLAGRIQLADLKASGVDVALTSTKTAPKSSSPLSLQPPLDIVLEHVAIRDIHIRQDGKTSFVANTLDLAAAWTSHGLIIRQLQLKAPDGHATLTGEVALSRGYRGKGHGEFRWKVGEDTWAGTLNAHSDGKQAQLTLALASPMHAKLDISMQPSGRLPWQAQLKVPPFDPQPLLGDTSLKTLAVALSGKGTRTGGTLQGNINLDQTRFDLHPLKLHYDTHTQKVLLDQLTLTSPQIKGTLEGHGTLDLKDAPASADLAIQWQDVQVPADIAGQALASNGRITLVGSAEQYRLQGKVDAGPPKHVAHLTLDLTGTPEKIALDTLDIKQPKGSLNTHGTLTLKPAMAWDLTIKGDHFNPGQLLAGWNGSLNMDLATYGRITPNGPDATFELDKLDGHLRQRSLSGHGKLHVTPARVLNGKLALSSGHSKVAVDATGTRSNHVDIKLAIVSLNDWLPDASGALHGNISVRGLWPKLAVDGHIDGQELALDSYRVGTLDLKAHIPDLSHPGGHLDLKANQLAAGSMRFKRVTLKGNGNAAHHELHLDADGQPLSLRLALTGAMHDKAWNGTLSTLNLDIQGLPPWRLRQPSQLAWNKGKASLSNTCLTAGKPVLCVSAQHDRNGALKATYHLQQIPLTLIATAIGDGVPLRSDGVINGEGQLQRSANGDLSGQATLLSPKGRISYPERPDLPLLDYTQFSAKANLAPDHQHITLAATFSHGGSLSGEVDIAGKQQALSGQINMRLDSLAPVELFTSAVANVKGHLDGRFKLGGTLKAPTFAGQARLQDAAAELPALGLKLHDGQVNVTTADARQLQIDGHIASGDGTLKLGGTVGLGKNANTHLTIQGNDVLAVNIPAAKVSVSPDMVVKRDTQGMDVTGKVAIDKADIKLEKLPGAGAVKASPDVVVVDDKKQEKKQAALPVSADIMVDLGQHTHLVGYGLSGDISGQLRVHQAPGKATTGQGQIVINGTYKAYGQDLVIKQGHLLFASTPIDDPGLDIRAVRDLHPNATINDGQVVGLRISGTARRPVINVFSNPTMEQSDALSYLITGKPLSSVSGGEGNLVNAAAQALGSAAGNLLAKGIGAKLGIEAGVASNTALGTAAFTVGKYLSPRLYLSYGVGLFDPGQVITLRYILSQRWNFEAEQATEFSRASFNYRIEK